MLIQGEVQREQGHVCKGESGVRLEATLSGYSGVQTGMRTGLKMR